MSSRLCRCSSTRRRSSVTTIAEAVTCTLLAVLVERLLERVEESHERGDGVAFAGVDRAPGEHGGADRLADVRHRDHGRRSGIRFGAHDFVKIATSGSRDTRR